MAKAKMASKEPKPQRPKDELPKTNPTTDEQNNDSEEVFEDGKYKRRNISSNWTKYEIPSEDEDEAEATMTGDDFNYVLETTGRSCYE